MRYAMLIAAGVILAGCFATTYGVTCPELKAYSPEFQRRAAAELPNASPEIQQMVSDYGGLRDAVRACERRRQRE